MTLPTLVTGRRCGTCEHWRGTPAEPGQSRPVELGQCSFHPAPQVFSRDRTCSENDGRGCSVYEPKA